MSDAFAGVEASAVAAGEEIDASLRLVAPPKIKGMTIAYRPTNTPRERLFDLAGEAFAMGRDADAHQIRTLATERSDKEVAASADMAEDVAALWADVVLAVQWMRDTLPAPEEKVTA